MLIDNKKCGRVLLPPIDASLETATDINVAARVDIDGGNDDAIQNGLQLLKQSARSMHVCKLAAN